MSTALCYVVSQLPVRMKYTQGLTPNSELRPDSGIHTCVIWNRYWQRENVHTGCKSCVVECSIRSQWPLDSDCGINQSSTILDSKSTTQMCLTKFESMADAGTPVASFSKEVYWRLAKRPLFFNGRFSLSPVKFLRKRGHRVIPHTWLATVNRLLMLTTGPHDSHIKS